MAGFYKFAGQVEMIILARWMEIWDEVSKALFIWLADVKYRIAQPSRGIWLCLDWEGYYD
jgi:hypothetical protein